MVHQNPYYATSPAGSCPRDLSVILMDRIVRSIEADQVLLHLSGLAQNHIDVGRVGEDLSAASLSITVVELFLAGLALFLLLLNHLVNNHSILTLPGTLERAGLSDSHAAHETGLVTDLGITIGGEAVLVAKSEVVAL